MSGFMSITIYSAAAAAAAYVSERGTASGVGCHGLTTEANACHFTWKDVNTLHVTHYYQYWYWVLVSAVANTIGYGVLGGFLGIVLTLMNSLL